MARVCRGVFEQYQFARVNFVQEVATMATKPDLIDVMHEEGVIHQLHPLLSDNVRRDVCFFSFCVCCLLFRMVWGHAHAVTDC
mgnify:CR=1 FL=1